MNSEYSVRLIVVNCRLVIVVVVGIDCLPANNVALCMHCTWRALRAVLQLVYGSACVIDSWLCHVIFRSKFNYIGPVVVVNTAADSTAGVLVYWSSIMQVSRCMSVCEYYATENLMWGRGGRNTRIGFTERSTEGGGKGKEV